MPAVLLGLILNLAAGHALAETRTLKLYFGHTGEHAKITFKKNGRYVQSGLRDLNRFLRDWRRNEPTKMDPRLFDLVWEIYQESGSKAEIHVVSAYRSPATNALLRSRSSGVAKKSQHMVGRALDFYLPDVPVSKVRKIGMKFQVGGVGYYPRSGSPFVHVDVGSVRSWPRMNRKELAGLFPNGKTLHLPSDGKPLPGYDKALADYKSRVTSSSIQVAGGTRRSGGGVIAGLFSGGRNDEQPDVPARQSQDAGRVASAAVVDDKPEEITLAFIPVPRPRPVIEEAGVELAIANNDDLERFPVETVDGAAIPILASATPGDSGLGPTAQDGLGTLISSLSGSETDAIKVASLRRPPSPIPVTGNLLASPDVPLSGAGGRNEIPGLAYVPVPRGRPAEQGEEGTVELASATGIPVPLSAERFRGSLGAEESPERPVVVALAPPTVDSDSYRPMVSAATRTASTAGNGRVGRLRVTDRRDPAYSVNAQPRLTSGLVTSRSLLRSRMVASTDAFVAPEMLSAEMRMEPSMVHMKGFSTENSIAIVERFSGTAVNFETVWKFRATN